MTLTLAAVYVPFAFSTGRSGKLFIEFALTLAGAVMVSGFTALTLSPMMSSRLLRHEKKHGRFYELGERVLHGARRRLPGRAAAGPGAALVGRAASAALVLAGVFVLFTQLPDELAPPEDQGLVIGFAHRAGRRDHRLHRQATPSRWRRRSRGSRRWTASSRSSASAA